MTGMPPLLEARALVKRLGGRLVVSGWLVWVGGVILSGVLATGLAFAGGLSRDARSGVIRRVRAVIVGRGGGAAA